MGWKSKNVFIKRFIFATSILFLNFFIFSDLLFAETITLKSGKTVEGKIIEKTDKYVKIDFYGVTLTYYNDEIQSMSSEAVKSDAVAQLQSPAIDFNNANLYIDNDLGFKVFTPRWMEASKNSRQISFNKEKGADKDFSAKFLISIDDASNYPNVNSSFSYAQGVENDIKKRYGDHVNIIEPSKSVKIESYDAASLTYEILAPKKDEKGNNGVIIAHHFYYLGDKVAVLMFCDGNVSFKNNIEEMIKHLQSFRRLALEDTLTGLKKLSNKKAIFQPLTDNESYLTLKQGILDTMSVKKTYQAHLINKDRLNNEVSKYDYKEQEFSMTFLNKKSFEFEQYIFTAGGIGDIWRVWGDKMYFKIGFWMPMPTALEGSGEKAAFEELDKNRREAYKGLEFEKYIELLKALFPSGISQEQGDFIALQFMPNNLDFCQLSDQLNGASVTKNEIILWIYKKDNTIRIAKATIEGKDKSGKSFLKESEHYFMNFDLPFTLDDPVTIY